MSHSAREPKPIDRIQQVWASVVNKYAAELIPERLRNGVLMVSGPHEVISALSEFSRRQLVERINQELGGKVVNGVQFHPVRLACITAYSQQLPKREILFLREPFKIERLGGRHYMQISDHLHYLVQHVGADGKFDHNEGAWPIAKDRRSRAVDVLNNYCDNLPSLPTVLANLSLDIANDLGKLVDRTRQRFVTSRAFGAGAVAVGALEQAVDLWKEVFGQEPEGLRERTDEAKQALLMVERQESWSRLN